MALNAANPDSSASAPATITLAPQEERLRRRMRCEAERFSRDLPRGRPPERAALEPLARRLMAAVGAPEAFLGFAMVAISNEFWREQFGAVPFSRRLLLLPHCLRDAARCAGRYDAVGLKCAACGACPLLGWTRRAERLGYRVLVAEGTPGVVQEVLAGRADALLGVACLDSLEKAFARLAQIGVPHVAVPLLSNGCRDTVLDRSELLRWLAFDEGATPQSAPPRMRSFLPLLRAAERLFDETTLRSLLEKRQPPDPSDATAPDRGWTPALGNPVHSLGIEWLRAGGKRFRPFITLAAYAAGAWGERALDASADVLDRIPGAVRRMAVAIECLHKASLAHDDVEDDDAYRYGRETLHRRYGAPTAIRVGDVLVGLGYRLVAEGASDLGPECAEDILSNLTAAHLRLCEGQGAELALAAAPLPVPSPADVQRIYALKTSPAFEAALFTGLRPAVPQTQARGTGGFAASSAWAAIRRYCRFMGVAYQLLNDLKDCQADVHDKRIVGQDLLAARPTLLRALAFEGMDAVAARELLALERSALPREDKLERLRRCYAQAGAFERADRLATAYRKRAVELAEQVRGAAPRPDGVPPHWATLGDVMLFIVETAL